MKLSVTSPIVLLVGPFRPAPPRVSVVADVAAKAKAVDVDLGGKRAHRARVASVRSAMRRVRSHAR
jgi:hypothetical protein